MTTYVIRNGQLIDKRYAGEPRAGKRPYVISDAMPAMRHPITGKLMDSKSEFRKVTRAYGCTEVGNETWPARPEPRSSPVQPDIVRAFEQLRNR